MILHFVLVSCTAAELGWYCKRDHPRNSTIGMLTAFEAFVRNSGGFELFRLCEY